MAAAPTSGNEITTEATGLRRELGLWDLVLLNVVVVVQKFVWNPGGNIRFNDSPGHFAILLFTELASDSTNSAASARIHSTLNFSQ